MARKTISKPAIGHASDFPPVLSARNGFLINKAAQRAREMFDRNLAPLRIRSKHYGIMTMLFVAGPLSQQAIGEVLRIDRTTMVMAIDDLERLGLAVRARNLQDRRAHRVQLTRRGAGLLKKARRIALQTDSRFLDPLSQSERRQLHALLLKLQ